MENKPLRGFFGASSPRPEPQLATPQPTAPTENMLGNIACNFKKIPTLTQDLSRRCIAMIGGECVYAPS